MTISTSNGEFAIAPQYASVGKDDTLNVVAAFGKGRLTWTGIGVADQTVTIGTHVYTFKASVAATADQVKVATTAAIQAQYLAEAINAVVGSGTHWGSSTVANTDVSAEYSNGVVFLTALVVGKAANSVATTETSTNATFGAATLLGGLDAALYDLASLTWKRYRVTDEDYGIAQMQDTIEPEIGRVSNPTGAYKSGVALAGGATMKPRLKNSIGWILLAALGQCTTVDNMDGTYTHTFTYKTGDDQYQPWMAVRSLIPGTGQIDPLGTIGYDNKVANLRLVANAARPIETRVDFEGRIPVTDHHGDVWSGASFEDFTTAALACKGTFKMPTVSELPIPLPVTQVTLELANALTGPREEMVVSSYFMDNIITRFRSLSLRFMYKWNDSALFDRLFANVARGTAWSPATFQTATASTNYAFDLLLESTALITGVIPFSLRVRANSAYWESSQPVRQQGGGIVMMDVRGTVLAPASGAYCEFILINDTASYTMPSQP